MNFDLTLVEKFPKFEKGASDKKSHPGSVMAAVTDPGGSVIVGIGYCVTVPLDCTLVQWIH